MPLLMAGAASVGMLIAQQQGASEKSSPLSLVTNQVPDASGLEALRRIEGQINRALGGGSRKSLEGLMAPPTPTVNLPPPQRTVTQPPRRTLEDLEKRKNWMFQNPDETRSDKKGEETSRDSDLAAPEGVKLTPMERYYQRLGGTIPGMEDQSKNRRDTEDRQGTRDEDIPGGIGNTAKELRKLLQDREDVISFAGASQNKETSLFGFGEPLPTAAGLKTEPNPVLQQYKTFLRDLGRTPSADSGAATLNSSGMLNGPNLGPTSPRDALAAQVTGLTPLASPILPDLNGKALNSWNPMYTAPAPVAPKALSAPAPVSFDAPRRKFN